MSKRFIYSLFFSFFCLLSFLSAGCFLDVYSNATVSLSSSGFTTFNVSGSVFNSSNSSQALSGVNVSVFFNGVLQYLESDASGFFSFNLTAPNSRGFWGIQVNSSNSTYSCSVSKNLVVYLTNVSSSYFFFTGLKPPFVEGNTFGLRIQLHNDSGPMEGYFPLVEVFSQNGGNESGWSITNTSSLSDSNGSIYFNLTVPSGASGGYLVMVDRLSYLLFFVRSSFVASLFTETENGEKRLDFYPGQNVSLRARIRDLNGNPVNSSLVSGASALITLPNSTGFSYDFVELNQLTNPGEFALNYSIPLSSEKGVFLVRFKASVNGSEVIAFASFSVQDYVAKLSSGEEFFFEWGGNAAFAPGKEIGFSIIVSNLSGGDALVPASYGTSDWSVDCLNASISSVWNLNGSVYDASDYPIVGRKLVKYSSTNVCRFSFNAPNSSGFYGVRVSFNLNKSDSNESLSAEGFFSVQKYLLKAKPFSEIGGGKTDMPLSQPGENLTIELSAFNLSSGTEGVELNGSNITSCRLVKIVPGGSVSSNGLREFTEVNNYPYCGNGELYPKLVVKTPDSTGPFEVEVEAIIEGENVTGRAFFMSKYVVGFFNPSSANELNGHPKGISCSGNVSFSAVIHSAKTNQPVSGVFVNNSLSEARSELTWRNVRNCLSIQSASITDSNGLAQLNVSFSDSEECSGLSGGYFVLIDVVYQGNSDVIPGFFMCKNLDYSPKFGKWSVGPNSLIDLIVENVSRDRQEEETGTLLSKSKLFGGNLTISRAFAFDPTSGREKLLNPVPGLFAELSSGVSASMPYDVLWNQVELFLYPSNFTDSKGQPLVQWPNGFIDFEVIVCDNGTRLYQENGSFYQITPVCDTMHAGGIKVRSFDSWTYEHEFRKNYANGMVFPGQNVSVIVFVQANVTRGSSEGLSNRFKVRIGSPWEGRLVEAPQVGEAVLLQDFWNSSQESFDRMKNESWNITFTVPETVSSGSQKIIISINATDSSSGEPMFLSDSTELWGVSVSKYSVYVLAEEGLMIWSSEGGDGREYIANDSTNEGYLWVWQQGNPEPVPATGRMGTWNMTELKRLYNIESKSQRVCARSNLTTTRYSDGGQFVFSNDDLTNVLILDNLTSGKYDTLVLNRSGEIAVVTEGSILNATDYLGIWNNLYLWKIDDCFYARLVNKSYSPAWSWGGQHEVNSFFSIPFMVKRLEGAVSNAFINVTGIIKQKSFGGGMSGKGVGLEEIPVVYSVNPVFTDLNGVGFVKLNVSTNGRLSAFWKISTSTDLIGETASFSTAIPIEVRARQTYGDLVWGVRTIRLVASTADSYNLSLPMQPPNALVFAGYFDESSTSDNGGNSNYSLVWDNQSSVFYFVLVNKTFQTSSPATNKYDFLYVDDDTDVNNTVFDLFLEEPIHGGGYVFKQTSLNSSEGDIFFRPFEAGFLAPSGFENQRFKIGNLQQDSDGNYSLSIYLIEPKKASNGQLVLMPSPGEARRNVNITVSVCAVSFSKNPEIGTPNASIRLYTKKRGPWWPEPVVNLTMYHPFNATPYSLDSAVGSPIKTGPQGCVAFNVSHPSWNNPLLGSMPAGWTAGFENEIEAEVYYNQPTEIAGLTDEIWVARVFVPCLPGTQC